MSRTVSKEEVQRVLAQVKHPEIARTLIELGMIKDVEVEDDVVTVTMALPLPAVPIQDYLAQIVTDAVSELSGELNVKVKFVEMNSEEKEKFFEMARQGWIGSI